jgi:phage regulator Rha-like protein
MSDLLKVVNNNAYVSNFKLADGFGLDVRSINRLITDNTESLLLWGDLIKEVGVISNHSKQGGHNKITYLLNEQQAMYLMTYTRRNEKTDKFRIDLINAFMKLRENSASGFKLLLEAEKLMNEYKERSSGWGKFGVELKKQKPLIHKALENAEKLAQRELNLEVVKNAKT